MEYKIILKTPLLQDAIKKLERIKKDDPSHQVRNRAHAIILLFDSNRPIDDVASIFKVHSNTVRNWAERWFEEGFDGLYDLPGRGAKPIYNDDEEKIVIDILNQEPRSLRRVAGMIEEKTGKSAGVATIVRIIKKHGKSWKRNRKILKNKPFEEEYENAKAEIEEQKNLAQDGEFDLVYADASGFSLQPCIPYAWQDIGRNGTNGILSLHSARINIFGFLNPAKRELSAYEHAGSLTSAAIISILDDYCESIVRPTVAIIDNASIHTSKATSEHFRKWEKMGLTLYFLPPYSPQLNLIEILWRKIKYEWIPSIAYSSMNSLRAELNKILDSYGSKYVIEFTS
jgi:transposase